MTEDIKSQNPPASNRQHGDCLCCGDDRRTSLEYRCRLSLLKEAGLDPRYLVCLSCLKIGLGRDFTAEDFPNTPVNCFVLERARWSDDELIQEHPQIKEMILISYIIAFCCARLLSLQRRIVWVEDMGDPL